MSAVIHDASPPPLGYHKHLDVVAPGLTGFEEFPMVVDGTVELKRGFVAFVADRRGIPHGRDLEDSSREFASLSLMVYPSCYQIITNRGNRN